MTIFVQNNVMKVYDSAGPYGLLLAELTLSTAGSENGMIAFDPSYPTSDSSTYYFNIGDLIPGITRNNACTLFDSENDYPLSNPVRSVGADGIGNHIGKTVFNKETYTFWITYSQSTFVLPHSGSRDWDAQIICVM